MKTISEHWLSTGEAAEYLNVTDRIVRINANSGKYGEIKKEGKNILIPFSGLPSSAQLAYYRDHNLTPPTKFDDDGWDQEPNWKRDIAAERIQIITAWEHYIENHPNRKRTDLTQEFIKTWVILNPTHKKFTVPTLYLWKQKYQQYGRTALLPGWGEKPREETMNPQAWAYFYEIYGTQRRRTASDCYRELQTVALTRGWEIPSLRTIQRKIEKHPKADWIYRREGPRAFAKKCLPDMKRDRPKISGNEIWVGDCHRLDFFVKGPNGKPVRPVLSGWVDFRSVKWVGWHIDYTGNTDTVKAAIGVGATNPDIRLPYGLYMDNGREFDNTQLAYGGHRKKVKIKEIYDEIVKFTLTKELGIENLFALPKNPQSKVIEREFLEVVRNFSRKFVTYCGSKPEEKPENLEQTLKNSDNLPDLKTVRDLFAKFVNTERNQRVTQGQGRKGQTPDQVYFATRLPLRVVPEFVLKLLFMPHTKPKQVTNNGINLFDTDYYNIMLIKHIGEEVVIRYRNEDLSKVYLFTLDDQYLCEAEMQGLHHPTQAPKEEFETHKRLRKRAKACIEEIKENLPDHGGIMTFDQYLNARAEQCVSSTPEKSNVISMVQINPNLLQSAILMQKAVGGETYQSQAKIDSNINDSFAKLNKALLKMQNTNGGNSYGK